jgi:hypothetical protein
MKKLDERLSDLTVAKLRPARYNPRTILESRLSKLDKSIRHFGDLSGVVFNVRTGNLVSGHQRMKTIRKSKTRIVQTPHVDNYGTIAVGYIEVDTDNGVLKIPYRAVDWNIKREKAANIAANAHGGDFDKEKLALVIADLENSKEFDVEIVGLDPLTLKSLRLPKDLTQAGSNTGASRNQFKEYDEDTVELQHQCPKCRYRW